MPTILYGTAWKEERTATLTELAIRSGFRGIDTANQRRHYFEAGVGEALAAVYRAGVAMRADLFLQTKFTSQPGQDHRLPYDPGAPIPTQVEQSFSNSLEHLGTGVIDSYLLHGPTRPDGLAEADWEAWGAMEAIHDSGRARLLGSGTYRAMLVPDEAIITDQTRKLVYVVGKDGKVAPRPVETGPQVEGLRVIKTGLGPAELVVIEGITTLQPGIPVKANKVMMKPRAADTSPTSQPDTAPPASEATTK